MDPRRRYRQGLCDAMALALHRLTGLPLVLFVGQTKDRDWGGWCEEPAHVAVSPGKGLWIDVDGLHRGLPKGRLLFIRKPERVRMRPSYVEEVRYIYSLNGVPEEEVEEAARFALQDPQLHALVMRYHGGGR
jgi:hypothetical protein